MVSSVGSLYHQLWGGSSAKRNLPSILQHKNPTHLVSKPILSLAWTLSPLIIFELPTIILVKLLWSDSLWWIYSSVPNLIQIRRVELYYASLLLFWATRCHGDNITGGYRWLWEVVFFQTKLRPSPGCLRGPGILLMSIYIRMFRHYKIKYRSSKGIKINISSYPLPPVYHLEILC